jgi:hypothetical protein
MHIKGKEVLDHVQKVILKLYMQDQKVVTLQAMRPKKFVHNTWCISRLYATYGRMEKDAYIEGSLLMVQVKNLGVVARSMPTFQSFMNYLF